MRTDHKVLQWLFSKEPKASTRISGWLATLTDYPVVIEYLRGSENTIADILSRLSGQLIEDTVPSELACGIPTYVCPTSVVDLLEARTDWISEQRAIPTISRVMPFLRRNEKPTEHDLLDDPLLKQYLDV